MPELVSGRRFGHAYKQAHARLWRRVAGLSAQDEQALFDDATRCFTVGVFVSRKKECSRLNRSSVRYRLRMALRHFLADESGGR
jgi:hypothetical protein